MARARSPLYWPLPPFGPSMARRHLLCPRLTSALRSGHLATASVPLLDTAQTSRGKTDRLRRTLAGFTTPAFDDPGLCDHLLARPTEQASLSGSCPSRPRLCSTLLSDAASRRHPCASLTLRRHQA